MKRAPYQIDLFEHVAGAYAQPESGRLTNDELYRITAGRAGIGVDEMNATSPIGQAGSERSLLKRKIRWYQQELRNIGVIQHVEGQRGVWELTAAGRSRLRKIKPGASVLGFSTKLGVAIWGDAKQVFERMEEPICLGLFSPPYPLAIPRAYGNPTTANYLDFLTPIIEPIVKRMVPGGNLAIVIGNDVFERKSPARSTYVEELTLTLCKRFGLQLMDRLVWVSNKPPGPIQYSSIQRVQLSGTYEWILWFTTDASKCIADNRRILEPHSEAHRKLIERGGERQGRVSGDGAQRVRRGAYGNPTEGRIPRNVLNVANTCADQRVYKNRARALGLMPHGAPMPLALARKLVRFLSDVDQLVVDPFGGSATTARACEIEGRRWLSTEIAFEYIRGAAERFTDCDDFQLAIDVV
ncbi:DNA methylase N-4/N-6 domain protein [Burkholderia gladioli]|uniref:Methyltransferase n=1 Tax=Burkholderia gladioli TaxID=28095 RepID=A0A2A7SAP1_BURGA|nr:site-specific DNA-methyltransferase [Burkholderia gladioli]PEH40503.1 DNA methylase N-4/N-6 domain protein [Burkholderia gladioli]